MKRIFFVMLMLVAGAVFAEGKTSPPRETAPPSVDQLTEVNITQSPKAVGGAATATSTAAGGSLGDVSLNSRYIGLAGNITQASPSEGPGCPLWVPGDGKERSWLVLGVATSAVLERDPECWAIFQAEVNHRRAMERDRLALERELIALERDRLARAVLACSVVPERSGAVCPEK